MYACAKYEYNMGEQALLQRRLQISHMSSKVLR